MSQLVCLGRHTVTGLLCASGRQFFDWSADHRLFSRERVDTGALFDPVVRGVLLSIPKDKPLVVGVDDTLLKKSGKRTPGVSWRRDPMGPPFQVNLIRAQKVIQVSAAVPQGPKASPARMIPIDFKMVEKPVKPGRRASADEWRAYRDLSRELSLPKQASRRIASIRDKIDCEGEKRREMVVVADGGYTNSNMLKHLPQRTTFIGRIRADAKLYRPPLPQTKVRLGRKRLYGERSHTPEELRQDDSVSWERVKVFAAGKVHSFKVKTVSPVLWRAAGPQPLRLVVIAPLSYRPRKSSKILYRRPAYLISTDTDMPLDRVIQYYVWRWDMEVNFRDEKQLIGVGEAQVHSKASVESAPAFAVASYAMLLIAAHRAFGEGDVPGAVPPPKWQSPKKIRPTTRDLIGQLRAELWGEAIGKSNSSGFTSRPPHVTKPSKSMPDLVSAVLYAA